MSIVLNTTLRRALQAAFALAAGIAFAGPADAGSYRLENAVTIPSSDTGWDYNALDAERGLIFIAHRKDGLHVYDTKAGKVVKTMEESQDTNTAALAPEFDIGIAGTTDGHVVVFQPSTLKTLSRYKSSTDGFDGATFDTVSKRFAMVGETDEEKGVTPVLFFDSKSGKQIGSTLVASRKVDAPRPDDAGGIFLPLRDKGSVVKIDMKTMKVAATFPLRDCLMPAALEMDNAHKRIFVGCRGKGSTGPALAVLDSGNGKPIARLPIGRGVDEVMYDPQAKSIVTANGEDGSMTVIAQKSADEYSVSETVGTRPMARTGVLDEKTGKIYLVNAAYVDKYEGGKKVKTSFVPDSFSILTYSR